MKGFAVVVFAAIGFVSVLVAAQGQPTGKSSTEIVLSGGIDARVEDRNVSASTGAVLEKSFVHVYFLLSNKSANTIETTSPGISWCPLIYRAGGETWNHAYSLDPPPITIVQPGKMGFWIKRSKEAFAVDPREAPIVSMSWIYEQSRANIKANYTTAILRQTKETLKTDPSNPLNLPFDHPKSNSVDPADVPEPEPTPIPPAKMLPAPTEKGFSQTLAAVVDAPQADLAFLLLNGDKERTPMPLNLHRPGNNFSVMTPSGKVVKDEMDKMQPRPDMKAPTLKPGELKIWKVNIKAWFDAHKLTAPGFYSLTWTCEGQKSEPFNLYIPTPEEKARLDKEAAQNR